MPECIRGPLGLGNVLGQGVRQRGVQVGDILSPVVLGDVVGHNRDRNARDFRERDFKWEGREVSGVLGNDVDDLGSFVVGQVSSQSDFDAPEEGGKRDEADVFGVGASSPLPLPLPLPLGFVLSLPLPDFGKCRARASRRVRSR